jgi:hypothetical protein
MPAKKIHRISWRWWVTIVVGFAALVAPPSQSLGATGSPHAIYGAAVECRFWVAPPPAGSDANDGTATKPWATLQHAAENVPDSSCTVLFRDGVYTGTEGVERRFATVTTFRAEHPYRAIFENDNTVIDIDGGRSIVLEGFEFRHSGLGAKGYVVIVSRSGDDWAEHITFRNNIFHDSFDNDLLKIHDGSRFVTVEGNVFYNQGESEQHMDVNSVTDVVIQDNVFFNDFSQSGRSAGGETKHYIIVKDSNEGSDGLLGSRRITIRRNVFLNWQGGVEMFVKIGNDGKPYHEAQDVRVENNLMIGNSPTKLHAPFGVAGARDVVFINNTVVGDLPSGSYGFHVDRKGSNPRNENIRFANNVWSDPTGTMGDFSGGDPDSTVGLTLENNLYWNDGVAIPPGDVVSPLVEDPRLVVDDPGINPDQRNLVVPHWTGSAFLSGASSIRQEFERLVAAYGRIPLGSAAVDRGDPTGAPIDDILGLRRDDGVDIGAVEAGVFERPSGAFIDVAGNPHEGFIYAIAAEGITRGCNPPFNDRYCPDDPVTRGQMSAFLNRALDLPTTTRDWFSDDDGSIFEDDINRLAAAGITKGCNPPANTRFCPDDPVMREQMAAFLVRAYEYGDTEDRNRFSDDDGSIFEDDIDRLAAAGVTKGCDPPANTRFCPRQPVRRDQMASFLGRAEGLAPVARPG